MQTSSVTTSHKSAQKRNNPPARTTDIALWGLFLYLIFVFFNPQYFISFIKPFRPALVIALFTFVAALSSKKVSIIRPLQTKLLLIFLFFVTVSTANSLDSTISFGFLEMYFKATILYFLFYMITYSELNFKKVIKTMVLFLFINCVITIIQQKLGLMPYRIHSFDGQGPNEYSLIILSMLPFPMYLIEFEKSKSKKAYYGLVILSYLLCLTRTRSRMGFLGLIVLLVQLLWLKRKNLKIILIIGFLVALTMSNVHYGYFSRVSSIKDDKAQSSRTILWNQAIELIKLRPYLGVGPGNLVMGKIYFNFEADKEHVTHNSFLEVGAENGVIAMVVYVLIMVTSLKHLLVAEKHFIKQKNVEMLGYCQASRMAFIALSFSMVFLSQQYNHFYYIFTAMSVNLKNLALKE